MCNMSVYQPNQGKELIVELEEWGRYARYPVKTHVVTVGEDLLKLLDHYVAGKILENDYLFLSEKLVAICQGRAFDIDDISPRPLARFLCKFVYHSPYGIGLGSPWTMELALRDAGVLRILFAALCSALTKPFGIRGVFYRVAGVKARAVDGPCDCTIPPYNHYAKMAPAAPSETAKMLSGHLGCRVVIIDANDLNVEVLGRSSREINTEFCRQVFRDNPLGQSSQSTPIAIVRRMDCPQEEAAPDHKPSVGRKGLLFFCTLFLLLLTLCIGLSLLPPREKTEEKEAFRTDVLSDAFEKTCLIVPKIIRRQNLSSLCLAFAFPPPELPESSPANISHEELSAIVENAAKKYGAVGLQAAVIQNGVATDSVAWGWAAVDTTPMTTDHKIRVASLSKVVLGMAAMCLREEGVIDPEEDIGKYWDCTIRNPAYPDTPITIRSLLSHTSSIYSAPTDTPLGFKDVKKRLQGRGYSKNRPGSMDSWCYNNYAFDVLGITLELASGQSVNEILQEHFFHFMEIDAAFSAGDISRTDLLATLYRSDGSISRSAKSLRSSRHRMQPCDKGSHFCGSLTISAWDLARLTALLAGDGSYEGTELFFPESIELMETIYEEPTEEGFYQALPLRCREGLYGRGKIYYHTGSAYGVHNCLSYDPDKGDGIVVLTVGAGGSRDENGIYKICSEINEAFYSRTLSSSAP